MNVETSIVCVDCGITYEMSVAEYDRFKALMATIKNFQMPRRCPDCRRIRRNEKTAMQTGLRPAPVAYAPAVTSSSPFRASPPVMAPAIPMERASTLDDRIVVRSPNGIVEAVYEEDEPAPAPVAQPAKEVVFMLATKDFEELVHGRPVVWQGVRVILAQIGFENMHKAVERAELEKAREHVKANGH